jgi:hypothetical protein
MLEGFLILLWFLTMYLAAYLGLYFSYVLLICYVVAAILLLFGYKKKYGSFNFLTLVPFCRAYFLGKTYKNETSGVILVIATIFLVILLLISPVALFLAVPLITYQLFISYRVATRIYSNNSSTVECPISHQEVLDSTNEQVPQNVKVPAETIEQPVPLDDTKQDDVSNLSIDNIIVNSLPNDKHE